MPLRYVPFSDFFWGERTPHPGVKGARAAAYSIHALIFNFMHTDDFARQKESARAHPGLGSIFEQATRNIILRSVVVNEEATKLLPIDRRRVLMNAPPRAHPKKHGRRKNTPGRSFSRVEVCVKEERKKCGPGANTLIVSRVR